MPKIKDSIAVLARLMIAHEIQEGSEIHLAYRKAVAAIESFGSALSHHLEAKTEVHTGPEKETATRG